MSAMVNISIVSLFRERPKILRSRFAIAMPALARILDPYYLPVLLKMDISMLIVGVDRKTNFGITRFAQNIAQIPLHAC